MCASKARDLNHAMDLFRRFLHEQDVAYQALRRQAPGEEVDLYRERIEDLLRNLTALMYYDIDPEQLDALLRLRKAHPHFKLLEETGLELEAYRRAVENLQTLLYGHGQLNTFRSHRPVDAGGAPVPWITYPAFEFLSQFDYSESAVFEFGSGNSTLFWAKRARSVASVETDRDWFNTLMGSKPPNVRLSYFADPDRFVGSILDAGHSFDIVVIDSASHRYRAACNAIQRVSDGGIIVLDNSDWYPNTCQLLRKSGLPQVDFHGFGPVNGYAWTTSVFFHGDMKFGRLAAGVRPIGGITAVVSDDTP